MSNFAVNEPVVALVGAEAQVQGEPSVVPVPAGSLGTVVFVHSGQPVHYDVEFSAGRKGWVCATLSEGELARQSDGRVYQALVCDGADAQVARKVAIVSKSLDGAVRSLEVKYGTSKVFSVYNEEDANLPRAGDA